MVVTDRHHLLRDRFRSVFAILFGYLLTDLPGNPYRDIIGYLLASLLGDLPAVLPGDPLWHRMAFLEHISMEKLKFQLNYHSSFS